MAKTILICHRNNRPLPSSDRLKALGDHLVPDNLDSRPARVVAKAGLLSMTINPDETLLVDDTAVCLGCIAKHEKEWAVPRSASPDGSYAIFRADDDFVELLTDFVGSRTIWYYHDAERLIASTSQRAIILLLGDFQLDERVIPWLLSSGTLGPEHSWDRRLRRLPPNGRLLLNRRTWQVDIRHTPAIFEPLDLPEDVHEERLRQALLSVIDSLDLPPDRWALPLSGGYDSRALLLLLNEKGSQPRCVTWGLQASLHQLGNDAYVARELAKAVGAEHQYFETDLSDEPVQQIFDRFLIAGEGRIDHISAYMDGFAIWRKLFMSGIYETPEKSLLMKSAATKRWQKMVSRSETI